MGTCGESQSAHACAGHKHTILARIGARDQHGSPGRGRMSVRTVPSLQTAPEIINNSPYHQAHDHQSYERLLHRSVLVLAAAVRRRPVTDWYCSWS